VVDINIVVVDDDRVVVTSAVTVNTLGLNCGSVTVWWTQ